MPLNVLSEDTLFVAVNAAPQPPQIVEDADVALLMRILLLKLELLPLPKFKTEYELEFLSNILLLMVVVV